MDRLNQDTLTSLINEIREGYNIPFFYSDDMLTQSIREADYYLNTIVTDIDYDEDLIAREFLKNRVLYSYNNRLDDFEDNYSKSITSWQLSHIPSVNDETEQE